MARPESAEIAPARVLIVEDQRDARALLRLALEAAGHLVAEAESLAAAREALGRGPVDLVLCDIHLGPGESGIDLLHELAPRSPDIAVVMVTGDLHTHTAVDCLRDGAFDYLFKPITPGQLDEITTRALRRQRRMIAERQRVEEQIRVLSQFSSENPNPVLRVARNGVILYANAASQTLSGRLNLEPGSKVPRFLRQFISDVLAKGELGETQIEAAERTFSFAVTPIKEADYVYLYGHDITRLKETERELVRLKEQAQVMALHDPLTGLPNRTLLEDRLELAVAHAERNDKKLAVAFIDLDNFKEIN